MRWMIAAAALWVLFIGVALLFRAPHVDDLPPGGTVVLYTNGANLAAMAGRPTRDADGEATQAH